VYTPKLVGNERIEYSKKPIEIRQFRSADPSDAIRRETMSLERFSQSAIKDILSRMVQEIRYGVSIAYLPDASDGKKHEILIAEDFFYRYRDWDKPSLDKVLDERAKQIKSSAVIIMIHQYTEASKFTNA
jgi:hypothetical protein